VDVEAAQGSARERAAQVPDRERPAPVGTSPTEREVMSAKGATTSRELSRSQQLIARRMAESKATIPHFTLQAEIDMEECVTLRSEMARHLQRSSPSGHAAAGTIPANQTGAHAGAPNAPLPSYNDMVVKACALALREHPRVNGSYRDGRVELHSRVNVGVAVAVESEDPMEGVLIVPTVFDADIKSLGEIARESRRLAERVRAGVITPPELSGGTFTVSNLGMYGVRSFAAIINPPQAAIMSVGSLEVRSVVRQREIVARSTMAVNLACDHRMLYGADAARFLSRVRELLESPSGLLL
jgi:pyruvate dehydrogenase E2 component (dihydrolipoamide acetyltransferase)